MTDVARETVWALRKRIELCYEQIAASPYSHTVAAGWYAEDVPVLLDETARLLSLLLRAEEERDVLQKAMDEIIPITDAAVARAEEDRDEWEAAWKAVAQENRRLRALATPKETKEVGPAHD